MEEALRNCIIVTTVRFAHALANASHVGAVSKRQAGVLTAPIGMEDYPWCWLTLTEGHIQGIYHQGGLQGRAKGPVENAVKQPR